MASQKSEKEKLAENRSEKAELAAASHSQPQEELSVVVSPDCEILDIPNSLGKKNSPSSSPSSTCNLNNVTATSATSASSTSITPTSSSSSSSSNLRDFENLIKSTQQQPNGATTKTLLTSSSSSSSSSTTNNSVMNNNNPNLIPNNNISPTTTTSTTSSCSDLRRRTRSPHQQENDEVDFKSLNKMCPGVNCPEKIVLCLDLSSEMEQMKFLSRAGDRFSTLQLVKRTIGLFVQSKHRLDSRHEFGLVTVHETAAWFRDFTKDPRDISNLIEDLDQTCECSALDVGSLLKIILRRVEMPVMEDSALPPPYVVRVILIIGRSKSKLEMDQEVIKMLTMYPYLFIDVFYVHEPPSEQNYCEQIFDQLCSLDVRGQSYIFEVSKNLTKLYDNMAQLLAHPLQRPLQKDTCHRIRANMEEG